MSKVVPTGNFFIFLQNRFFFFFQMKDFFLTYIHLITVLETNFTTHRLSGTTMLQVDRPESFLLTEIFFIFNKYKV